MTVHHVTLTVRDPSTSAAWYQALLGPARIVERIGPTWTRVRLEWPGLVIGLTRHDGSGPNGFDATVVGLDHVGLACATEDEVRQWQATCDRLGIDHGPVEDVPYGWAVTARDPDGIPIEFFCSRAGEPPSPVIDGLGTVTIRGIDDDHPRPASTSTWADWGEVDRTAMPEDLRRWLIEVTDVHGNVTTVGDLSAHPVRYGPTAGSRALNIGISLVEEFRGRGIGAIAQNLLAEHLHDEGVVRVEASTDVDNVAEQRALARAGFVYEGVLRQAQQRADGLHDLQSWSHVRPGA